MQLFARARETHVTQSSLLFDAVRIIGGATQRKQSVFETGERDDRPLETLRHVRREQRDARHIAILVGGSEQRRLREVALHRTAARPTLERFWILHFGPCRGAPRSPRGGRPHRRRGWRSSANTPGDP